MTDNTFMTGNSYFSIFQKIFEEKRNEIPRTKTYGYQMRDEIYNWYLTDHFKLVNRHQEGWDLIEIRTNASVLFQSWFWDDRNYDDFLKRHLDFFWCKIEELYNKYTSYYDTTQIPSNMKTIQPKINRKLVKSKLFGKKIREIVASNPDLTLSPPPRLPIGIKVPLWQFHDENMPSSPLKNESLKKEVLGAACTLDKKRKAVERNLNEHSFVSPDIRKALFTKVSVIQSPQPIRDYNTENVLAILEAYDQEWIAKKTKKDDDKE